MTPAQIGLKIWVGGIVQGVGFRPFVYTLAQRNQLTGWVRNTSGGVEIEINGAPEGVQTFLHTLRHNPPPLARIDQLRHEDCPPDHYTGFSILASQAQDEQFVPISPDVAICADCRRELFDPHDRRYRYPFINCTNCGPRFTIIQDIPYDRPKTTMSGFALCRACHDEYENPLDRRFHAQPVACPDCGPQLWYERGGRRQGRGEEALQLARQALRAGQIVAVKGLGGFHLACDAAHPTAAGELRRRKKRSDKPFALMAFDLEAVKQYCHVTTEEAALLQSPQHPIVLLERRADAVLHPEVAPGQTTLGFMLAYTPLHLLLLEPAPGFPAALVMTSGNLSEEPIAYEDDEGRQRLENLADGFLLHDRPIHMRTDDSVARRVNGRTYLLRRARGYAPEPLALPVATPPTLAAGAELKNTFCLTRQQYAFLSHHIGDLENYETLRSFESGVTHFERLFRLRPEQIACDLHPDYLASRYAQRRAAEEGLPLVTVQHHHAHLAACLADNGWASGEAVIGLSFDGTGLGTDGAVWGGEVLLGGYSGYRRCYHLKYVPLPGGDQAVRKPARMALAHLWAAGLDWETDLLPVQALCYEERMVVRTQLERRLNAVPTSSMGRLFDAASALAGQRQVASYEGQAAIEFEACADRSEPGAYEFDIQGETIDPAPLWLALLNDWRAGLPVATLSARFHNGVVQLVRQVCARLRSQTGCEVVALSGGVWQNTLLLERTLQALEQDNFTVLWHRQLPANDGCIAVGQAMVAAHVH